MQEFQPCSVCSRSPLIGERITVVRSGRRESVVCDLCLDRPRAAALGEALRRERVRSATGAASVRRAGAELVRDPVAPAIAG